MKRLFFTFAWTVLLVGCFRVAKVEAMTDVETKAFKLRWMLERYSNENEGKLPHTLSDLRGIVDSEMLADALDIRRPDGSSAEWIYTPPAQMNQAKPEIILAVPFALKKPDGAWRLVLYSDFTHRYLADEKYTTNDSLETSAH
jgi:hypothetical protein